MTISKGSIQGCNGVATVDKKHQIIIDAQAFDAGQEQHTLKPVLEKTEERYKRLNMSDNIYSTNVVVTADTGFANEANMKYLDENDINAYIPDNQFRSCDPKFADQKKKCGMRHQNNKKKDLIKQFMPDEFDVDLVNKRCRCPMGKTMKLSQKKVNQQGHDMLSFRGQLKD